MYDIYNGSKKMMRKTRSKTAKKNLYKKKYAKTSKKSVCKSKKAYACVATPGCKMTKGKKRQFCHLKK